tara:strand:- start:1190 stop:1885 length:696 start_codon:yes stop_codon:yes gene_type:complete
MTDLIADLNRIHAGACRHVLHGDMPADPAELATVCRRAVEALTPPEDVGELVARLPGLWFGFNPGTGEPDGTSCTVKPHDDPYARRFIPAEVVADALSTQSAALALVTRERDEARAQVDACAEYLKPGETPAERIKREHDDCCALMAMLAKDRERRDAAEGQVSALTAERDRLRIALEDLTSWFDDGPSRYGPWIIKAGNPGADAAVEFARAALTPGRGADESGEAGDDEG